MRRQILVWLTAVAALALTACGSPQKEVRRLSLRDTRLPLEARRWLADTEDEVAIAKARMEAAYSELERIHAYQEKLEDEDVFSAPKGSGADGKKTTELLENYVAAQLELRQVQYDTASLALDLARARLTQVRAETAIRHDLAIYEMGPIVKEVEKLKEDVAASQSVLEDRRAAVETAADKLWTQYALFVKKGGTTSAFWKFRSLSAW